MTSPTIRSRRHRRRDWGEFCSGADGATLLIHRSSSPIPDRDNYNRPGVPPGVKLDEYINKAADAQAEHRLHRGFWISEDEYGPISPCHVNYATDAESSTRCSKHALPLPQGRPPKLIAIDANGISKRLPTILAGATAAGSEACTSTSTQLHRADVGTQDRLERSCERQWPGIERDMRRIGYACIPQEDEEIEIKEVQ